MMTDTMSTNPSINSQEEISYIPKVEKMATKMLLSLVALTVLVSAHRPLVNDRYLAPESFLSVRKVDGNGNLKVDNGGENAIANLGSDRSENDNIGRAVKPSSHRRLVDDRYKAPEPFPSVMKADGNGNQKFANGGGIVNANLKNGRSENDNIGRAVEPSSRSPLVDDRHQAPEPFPSVIKVDGNPGSDGSENNNIGREMKPSVGGSMDAGGSMGAGGAVSIGVTPITIPIPISIPMPGANGGFQFQLGPIGFGSNWSFGLIPPGSVVAYSQPIVVSPYSPPKFPPPYAGAPPSQQQPEMGYGQAPAQNFVPNPPGGWYSQSVLPAWYSRSAILNPPEEETQGSPQMWNPAAAPDAEGSRQMGIPAAAPEHS